VHFQGGEKKCRFCTLLVRLCIYQPRCRVGTKSFIIHECLTYPVNNMKTNLFIIFCIELCTKLLQSHISIKSIKGFRSAIFILISWHKSFILRPHQYLYTRDHHARTLTASMSVPKHTHYPKPKKSSLLLYHVIISPLSR
jgi:hypothetical protein